MSTDCFSTGHLVDEDLRLLYKGFGGMDTEGTPARLHVVKALGMQDLYFVDVEQWREALGGMEAVVLIPLICVDDRVKPLWGAGACYTQGQGS